MNRKYLLQIHYNFNTCIVATSHIICISKIHIHIRYSHTTCSLLQFYSYNKIHYKHNLNTYLISIIPLSNEQAVLYEAVRFPVKCQESRQTGHLKFPTYLQYLHKIMIIIYTLATITILNSHYQLFHTSFLLHYNKLILYCINQNIVEH